MLAKQVQRNEPPLQEGTSEPPPRRELDHPLLVLRVHPDDDRRTFFGYATNISRLGFRIDATNPRNEGEIYELEISLPEPLEGPAQCTCQVVWKRDWARGRSPGMGLRFLDLPDRLSSDLEAWIEEQELRDFYRRHRSC